MNQVFQLLRDSPTLIQSRSAFATDTIPMNFTASSSASTTAWLIKAKIRYFTEVGREGRDERDFWLRYSPSTHLRCPPLRAGFVCPQSLAEPTV